MNDEQRANQLLEAFQADLLTLIQREPYSLAPHVCITGLLELAGTLMRNGVQLEPAALPSMLDQIARVRAHVEAANDAEVPPLRLH